MFATRERGHIDIPTRDILNGRIGGLAKSQRIAGVGDNPAADGAYDARRVRFDRNGMGGSYVGFRPTPELSLFDLQAEIQE
jgi:hypothetical protein